MVLEKTLESPLDCEEIQPVNPKGNQSWIFIGRTDADAKAPILWPPDVKNWLIRKDPDAGNNWRWEKGMTEDEMVEWCHLLTGHEFEQALGVGEEQGSLACCHPWGRKELVTTKWLDWTGLNCQMEEDLLSFCLILRRVIKSWVEGIAAIMSGPSGTVFWGCCGLVQVTHSSRCLSILQRYLTSILMYSFFFFHLPLLLALSSSLLWTELCSPIHLLKSSSAVWLNLKIGPLER